MPLQQNKENYPLGIVFDENPIGIVVGYENENTNIPLGLKIQIYP